MSDYNSLASIPEGMPAAEYDTELDAICDAEEALFESIKTTPTKTIAGALAVIEMLDHYQTEMGWDRDPWTREAIKVRSRAVATIRRCLAEREG